MIELEEEAYDRGYYDSMEQSVTNVKRVKEFHRTFHRGDKEEYNRALRYDLMSEELAEVFDEMYPVLLKDKLAKELADLLYVVYGTAVTFDIDIDRAFAEVHKSNMSKLGVDGKPIYRDDGKVLKGPNYREADMSWVE